MTHSRSDYDFAVQAATSLFWRRGYDDTSIEDIVKTSGLNRYSIYNAYGGKEGIFQAAVRQYCDVSIEKLRADCESQDTPPLNALLTTLEETIEGMHKHAAGCLVTDIVLSKKEHFPELITYCATFLREMEELTARLFEKADTDGTLADDLSPAQATGLYLTFKFGLDRRSKLGLSQEEMKFQAEAFMDRLRRTPA